MKNKSLFLLALTMCIALASVGAQAMGYDVQAFVVKHNDVLAGLAMLMVGDIDLIGKSLDRIEGNFRSIKTSQAEAFDRILLLEQLGGLPFLGKTTVNGDSLGGEFLKAFDKNRDLFEKTRSVRLEIKAAGDAITTSSGRTIISGGVGAPAGAVLGLQNALFQRPVPGTTAVEYSRFTGTQGAAAQQTTEGGAKAPVRPDHSLIVQSALTIAGYSKMSRQALSDSAELKRMVDTTLTRSVGIALDVAICNGATGFSGGFEGLATAYTSLVYQGMADAVSEGVSTMHLAGFVPDVVALNPADWLAIVVKKGTANDHYLSGNYLGAMPSEMRGLRVVLSPSVDAGKALLLDSSHTELLIIDGFGVEVAYSGEDFTNNLVTILGEVRVIPIFRTTGSARLITPKV